MSAQSLSRRLNIDKTANDSGFCIRDLNRLVGTHDKKCVNPSLIAGLELLVHCHIFMGNDSVQLRIILDVRQIAIMFNSDKRVSSEGLSGELVVAIRNRRSFKRRNVLLEQPLDDVDDSRLSSAARSIKNQKLLDRLRISRHDGTDCPLNLGTVLRRVKCRDKFFPRRNITGFEIIREPARYIVLLFDFGVSEGELLV